MKRRLFSNLFIAAAAASLVLAGCASKPPSVEAIPETEPRGVGQPGPTPLPQPQPPPPRTFAESNPIPQPPINNPQPLNAGNLAPNPGDFGNWPHDTNIFKPFTVYFEFDRSNVRKSEMSKVESVASFFKDPTHAQDHVLIEGHCDERGTEQYNLALGDRRALSLRDYLAAHGVPTSNIHTVSYGLSRPAVLGHDPEAWSKNRRGEFILVVPPPGP
jgi:peptidoglycan-associated lipoprotein